MQANPVAASLLQMPGADSSTFPDVGETAGRVWHYLEQNGRTSVIRLKSSMGCSATDLHLALGWLLREGKIDLSYETNSLIVRLK